MRAAIVRRPIDVCALLDEVAATTNGATVLFSGTVRELSDGRSVDGIDYDAYETMAAEELVRIVAEACARHGTMHVVAEHRVGSLALGDVSVAIVAGHPHRAPAFDAARFVIEEIKKRLPVWKQERFTDGTREWVDARVSS
jgi:molybdopterin synthase catalytic subunit